MVTARQQRRRKEWEAKTYPRDPTLELSSALCSGRAPEGKKPKSGKTARRDETEHIPSACPDDSKNWFYLDFTGWPRFGSVRLRFVHGTVPVFGSDGSSLERVFLFQCSE